MPTSISTSCKFRVSMDQGTIKVRLSEKTRRKKTSNETNTAKNIREEKSKRISMRPRMVFPVTKLISVISGVFISKKTFAGENRGQIDDSAEITKTDGKVQPKQNQNQESLWQSAGIRMKILALGQRLKTRRRSLSEDMGEEEELCKKRILMGERCKPINKSGVLQYDAERIILPEP